MKAFPFLLLVMAGCADITAPDGAYPVTPPDFFVTYWQDMEACSGIHADMARIQWFAVPGNSFPTKYNAETSGLWVEPHTIYVMEGTLHEAAWGSPSTLVSHEMLHDLLHRGDHPPIFEACGVR